MLTASAKATLSSLAGKSEQLAIEAEQLLRFYAETFTLDQSSPDYTRLPQLTSDEKLLLRLAGFEVDERSLAREIGRIQQEHRIRERAGTKAEVESLEQSLHAITERNREDLPKLRREINSLEAKVAAAEEEQANTEQRLADMLEARHELRDKLPPYLRQQVSHEESWAQLEAGRELSEAQAEHAWLSSIFDSAINEREQVGGATHNLVAAARKLIEEDDECPQLVDVKGELNLQGLLDYLPRRIAASEGRVEAAHQALHDCLAKSREIIDEFVDAGFIATAPTQATPQPTTEEAN